MRFLVVAVFGIAAVTALMQAQAPRGDHRGDDFLRARPRVGDPLPELTAYAADGAEVRTADLRGHYTVLTFGCLT